MFIYLSRFNKNIVNLNKCIHININYRHLSSNNNNNNNKINDRKLKEKEKEETNNGKLKNLKKFQFISLNKADSDLGNKKNLNQQKNEKPATIKSTNENSAFKSLYKIKETTPEIALKIGRLVDSNNAEKQAEIIMNPKPVKSSKQSKQIEKNPEPETNKIKKEVKQENMSDLK
jgi:hypothetical protein